MLKFLLVIGPVRPGGGTPHGGGVAAPLREYREASEAAQTGWSLTDNSFEMRFEGWLVSDDIP